MEVIDGQTTQQGGSKGRSRKKETGKKGKEGSHNSAGSAKQCRLYLQ